MAASCIVLSACGYEAFGLTSGEEALLQEARAAISTKMENLDSIALKEDGSVDIHREEGLVCGDEVYAGESSGGDSDFVRYYYRRGSGAYLLGEAGALPIMQSCTEAFKRITDKF